MSFVDEILEVDPARRFEGRIVIAIPHMDDGVLACGTTIARIPTKERVHLVYATDGMRSPAPIVPGRDSISPDLGEVRKREAIEAMGVLGVPEENIHFLDLPDSGLHLHEPALERALREHIGSLEPDHVFLPFRFDRHPDHLAVHRAVTRARAEGVFEAELLEYFVYHHWRLLPRGDVRAYIDPHLLVAVHPHRQSETKREALGRFRSQTTIFYPWQTRPNLTASLLDEVSRAPELFLPWDAQSGGTRVFLSARPWIPIAHRLEPILKRHKDRAVALARRALPRHD